MYFVVILVLLALTCMLCSQSEGFAYGGCVVKSNFVPKSDNRASNCGVFFCGENLEAASIIISENCTQDEEIEAKISEVHIMHH